MAKAAAEAVDWEEEEEETRISQMGTTEEAR